MSLFLRILIFGSLCITEHTFAQDDTLDSPVSTNECSFQIISAPTHLSALVRANNLDNREISFQLLWSHHPQATDTFLIVPQGSSDTIRYITSAKSRLLSEPNTQLSRKMAQHNLREQLFYSTLRYDDLELLANSNFKCTPLMRPKGSSEKHIPLRSSTWFYFTWNPTENPTDVFSSGIHHTERHIRLSDWQLTQNNLWLPFTMEFSDSHGLWASIQLQSVEEIHSVEEQLWNDPIFRIPIDLK